MSVQRTGVWWHDSVLDRLVRSLACAALDFLLTRAAPVSTSGATPVSTRASAAAAGAGAPLSRAQPHAHAARDGHGVPHGAALRPALARYDAAAGAYAATDMLQTRAAREALHGCVRCELHA